MKQSITISLPEKVNADLAKIAVTIQPRMNTNEHKLKKTMYWNHRIFGNKEL